ncbi:MAG: hypothetical protein ABR955_07650 [Verrucomicrobiota bacterium]
MSTLVSPPSPAPIYSKVFYIKFYMHYGLRLWLARVSVLLLCFVGSQQLASAQASLSLSWIYTSTSETGFGVQRATSAKGPWIQVGTVAAPTTSYLDTGLKYSTTYYYRVWAYNAEGNSPFSGAAFLKTPPAPNPVVSIVSPKVNEYWSNSVFMVSGKAGDNVAVSNVLVSLNGSGWTNASTGNGWTNWTANVTLIPGLNVVQAYVVDISGKVSTTNTVKFDYILSAVLAVQTNSSGTISPRYNGALLKIGAHYAITARPEKGFGFVNWTDGDGNVITNDATLKFIMESNLTFVANFKDITPPTLRITDPTSNLRWSNALFTVTGKAADNVAVSNVLVSLNKGAWIEATLSSGGDWTAQVDLTPGINTIQAYAVDTSGNVSATDKVSFLYVLKAPLTVLINGNGRVSPNYNGALLQIGQSYPIKALASAGYVFTGWTGSLTTNGTTLRFIMASNLTFTANFVSKSQLSVQILPPEISDLSVNQSMATISFESTTGLLYTLESKDSLTDANWTALSVSIPGTGEGVSLTDSNAPTVCRFYRIRAQAAP